MCREIKEEINLSIEGYTGLIKVNHVYDSHAVTLHVFQVILYTGKLKCIQVSEYNWVELSKLQDYQLPPANQAIINALLLSDIHVITPEDFTASKIELLKIEKMILQGIDLLQIRIKEGYAEKIDEIINKIKSIDKSKRIKVIINSEIDKVNQYDLFGLHLKSNELIKIEKRPLDKKIIIGASCHNEFEIEKANSLGLDYIFISPVKMTKCYKSDQLIGWEGFSSLVSLANMPAYALGGLSIRDLDKAKLSGAKGVAMIKSIWD